MGSAEGCLRLRAAALERSEAEARVMAALVAEPEFLREPGERWMR